MCRLRRKQRRERRKEHEREGRFWNSAAKRCYLKYWMKQRAPRRMQLKTGQIHFTAYGGHVCPVTERVHRGYTEVQADQNPCIVIYYDLFHTPNAWRLHPEFRVQASACTYCILAAELVCDMIHSFSFSAGGPGPMPVLVEDLFTFVGWQEHEISSGCTVAARPANSMALQVFGCSRYRLPCPLLPACRPLVLRVTHANKQTLT